MFLVPAADGDYYVRAFLGASFALKTMQLIHLIVSQVTIDMFFLDWERPPTTPGRPKAEKTASIWRTYYVANEWNELSTIRRVDSALQLLLVTLLLKGVGLENLARFEGTSRLTSEDSGIGFVTEYSRVLRFAISSLVYIATGLLLLF